MVIGKRSFCCKKGKCALADRV